MSVQHCIRKLQQLQRFFLISTVLSIFLFLLLCRAVISKVYSMWNLSKCIWNCYKFSIYKNLSLFFLILAVIYHFKSILHLIIRHITGVQYNHGITQQAFCIFITLNYSIHVGTDLHYNISNRLQLTYL